MYFLFRKYVDSQRHTDFPLQKHKNHVHWPGIAIGADQTPGDATKQRIYKEQSQPKQFLWSDAFADQWQWHFQNVLREQKELEWERDTSTPAVQHSPGGAAPATCDIQIRNRDISEEPGTKQQLQQCAEWHTDAER